jgi:hypothetical protein
MTIFVPNVNVWRVERADRFSVLIDGAAFFGAVRQAGGPAFYCDHRLGPRHLVCRDEWSATICIETGEHLVGDIPTKELWERRAFREANLEVLRDMWREHHGPED